MLLDKFFQYASFRFEIGRQLHSVVRNNPLKILRETTGAGIFIQTQRLKAQL